MLAGKRETRDGAEPENVKHLTWYTDSEDSTLPSCAVLTEILYVAERIDLKDEVIKKLISLQWNSFLLKER